MENKEIADDLAMILSETINETIPVISDCIRALIDLATKIYKQYPQKRIVWLALYHPKAKVRKKNKSRIANYCKKHCLELIENNEN